MASTAQASGGAPKTYASVLSQPPKPIKSPGTVQLSNMTSLKFKQPSSRTAPAFQRQTPPLNTSQSNKYSNPQQGRIYTRVQQKAKVICSSLCDNLLFCISILHIRNLGLRKPMLGPLQLLWSSFSRSPSPSSHASNSLSLKRSFSCRCII
uniref:Uncharacterized protein n=1 Tax=Meloidogyne incognita TaxID=6306 RepID=A0A914M397_MELIC